MTKHNILFVDDEINVLKALQRALFLEDFTMHVADTPEKALLLIRENHYAVIVSDHRMPEMEGTTFLEHTKILAPQATRILLTGYADLNAATTAINEVQVFKFLSKPWNDEELIKILKSAIAQYEITLDQKFLELKNETIMNENLVLTQEKVLRDFENQRLGPSFKAQN